MNIVLEKQLIKQELDRINDESIILTLKRVLGLIPSPPLSPLTQDALIARAMESESAIKKGQYITLDDLRQELDNW